MPTIKSAVIQSILFGIIVFQIPDAVALTDDSAFDLDAIRQQLEFNEQAIRTYSGRVTHTQYVDVPLTMEPGFLPPHDHARVYHVTQTTFVRDRTRGDDYFARMYHTSPFNDFAEPWFVERRNGSLIEGLVSDRQNQPVVGIIPEHRNARAIDEMPRNFVALNHIYGISSEFPKGYDQEPVSAILKDHPERVWTSPNRKEVNGHPTILLAVTYPYGDFTRLSHVWLATDLNMAIVKQQTVSVQRQEMDLRALEAMILDKFPGKDLNYAMEIRLIQSVPAALTSHYDFQLTPAGVWLPRRTRSFMCSTPTSRRLSPGLTITELQQVALRYPDTQHLKRAIVRGYHEFVLDMNSVKINEITDPNIFETSVIPEGTRVSNFRTGAHPLALDKVLDYSIAALENDNSAPDSPTPERQPPDNNAPQPPPIANNQAPDTNDSAAQPIANDGASPAPRTVNWWIKLAVALLILALIAGIILYRKTEAARS